MPVTLIRFLPALVLATAFASLTAWSWGTWCDPIIDFGRELYVPWRLSEGEVLYRDIAWFNGPLSQYWNALVFEVAGVSLRSLVVVNLAIAALATWLVYRLCRHVAGRFAATAATLAFVTLCCFLQLDNIANFNWVCPYSHEMTHGVTALLGTMLALLRWQRTGEPKWAALAGGLLGLTLLTKPEIGLAAGATFLIALLLGPAGARRRGLLAGLAGAVIPVAGAWMLLATAMPVGRALQGALGGWLHAGNAELMALKFYRDSLGTSDVARSLLRIALWLGIHLAALLPGLVICFLPDIGRTARCVAAGALGVFLSFRIVPGYVAWTAAWTPLPVFLVAGLAAGAVLHRRQRQGAPSHRLAAWLVLCTGALAMLAKIGLNARLHHYGFGLAALALVVFVLMLVEHLPAAVARVRGDAVALRVWACVVLAFIGMGHVYVSYRWLAVKQHVVGRGADAFRAADSRAQGVQKMLGHLAAQPRDATLVVLPEGVMLNYLARRRNPTPYVNFMPPELIMFGEDAIVSALQAARPDLCLVVHRRTPEYGLPIFGRDYAKGILHWLGPQYEPVPDTLIGKAPLTHDGTEWGMQLARRRSP